MIEPCPMCGRGVIIDRNAREMPGQIRCTASGCGYRHWDFYGEKMIATHNRLARLARLGEAAEILEGLRSKGWAVAVHNDYHLNGEPHTFWLLTHPSGRFVKGEGRTDLDALKAALASVEGIK